MATITNRGEYQWHARIRRVGFPEQSKTFIKKSDAEAWVHEIEEKMDRGVFVDRSALTKLTLGMLLGRYEKEITPTKKGHIKERSKIRVLQRSYISGISLVNIHPVDIVEFRNIRSKEVAPATVTKEMNLLSNVFNVARSEWGLKGLANPVEGVRRPKQPKGRQRRLESVEEMDKIIAETKSSTLKVLIPLAVETAMRRSEMVGIMIRDINMDDRTIILRDTKNGETRTVPLSTRAMTILKAHSTGVTGRLFDVKPNSVTQAFKRALTRARGNYERECIEKGVSPDKRFLVNLRLHDMRHEATSRLFEKTELREFEIMAITGHQDTRQLKQYTHLRAANLAKKLG